MAAQRKDTLFEQLLKWVGLGTEKVDVLVVGLDNSGKTTLCNYLVNGEKRSNRDTVPTVGYETQEFYRDVSVLGAGGSGELELIVVDSELTRGKRSSPRPWKQNFSFQVIDMAGAVSLPTWCIVV